MKKVILLITLLSIGFVNAQEESPISFKKNELQTNPFTIFYNSAVFSYERILSKKFGIGINTGINYKDYKYFQSICYINWYPFGSHKSIRRYASGFFIQANMAVTSQDDPKGMPYPPSTSLGAGPALGWKLALKNNWIISAHFGFGINIRKGAEYAPDGYGTVGVNVGKRF